LKIITLNDALKIRKSSTAKRLRNIIEARNIEHLYSIKFDKIKSALQQPLFVENFYQILDRVETLLPKLKGRIEGTLYEAIVDEALDMSQISHEYEHGSHSSHYDIRLRSIGDLSLKTFRGDGKEISISSFRTTSYETIEEKIEYLDQISKKFDAFLFLVKTGNSSNLTLMNNPMYDIRSFKWEECKIGYKSDEVNGIRLEIRKKMSDQLWIMIQHECFDRIAINL
jgi:hypothetical protein